MVIGVAVNSKLVEAVDQILDRYVEADPCPLASEIGRQIDREPMQLVDAQLQGRLAGEVLRRLRGLARFRAWLRGLLHAAGRDGQTQCQSQEDK